MKAKQLFGLLLSGLLIVSAVGCGSSTTSPGSTTENVSSALSSASAPSESKAANGEDGDIVEIRFTEWDGGDTLEVYSQIIDRFHEENPNIRVTLMNIPSEYDTKITTMVAGNDIPEVSIMEAGTLLFPYAEEGIILNMQDYIDKDPDYDETNMLDLFKYKLNKDYLAGYGIGSENICMFYSPELFAEYKVPEPPASYKDAWDWDTFVDHAKTLTIDTSGRNAHDPEFDPEDIDIYGVSFGKWWAIYMPFIFSNGGDFLTDDGTSIGYATSEGLDALQKLSDLIHVHHVAPTPTTSATMPGISEALATKKVAMTIDGQWANHNLIVDGVSYNVAALPKTGDTAHTIATYGGISLMNTPKADAAWEFIKYMLSEGACEPLYQSGLWLPTNAREYTDEYMSRYISDKHPSNYYDAIVAPMLDGTAKPPVVASIANFNKINDVINPALDLLWSGEQTAEEAVASIREQANAEVKGYLGQ